MTGRNRVRALLVVLTLALVSLTGCVQVPTAGPIEEVEGETDACQSCVNVEVAPPAVGDDPRQVVDGYLRATSNYQPNYSVARQFLTRSAAETWLPEAGVSIYDEGQTRAVGQTVELTGILVGTLAEDRTYTAADRPLTVDFDLVRQDGEWRINRPPAGLMVARFSFQEFYTGYSVFYVANETSLVPERIYLPALRNPANVASALMTALLGGPSEWLDPAARSAIPEGTTLSAESVTITGGTAEVALSDDVLALADPARTQMAAQIVYTLRQITGVRGVRITAGQGPFRVPEGDPASRVIAADAFSRDFDPVPSASDQMFAIRAGRVQQVNTPDETPTLQPIGGRLGEPGFDPSALAVSVTGTDVAVASEGRTALHRSTVGGTGQETQLLRGVEDVLRPQFTRYGEIWAVGRQSGRQRLWQFVGDDQTMVDLQLPGGGEITAFRVSPDGVRIALVRRTARGSELGLARIIRSKKITVDGWRPIDLDQADSTKVTRISDVAWLDADELLVLGAEDEDAVVTPVRVSADASEITPESGVPTDWDARQFSVLIRTQTVVVVGGENRSWRDDGGQWREFINEVTAIAYPG